MARDLITVDTQALEGAAAQLDARADRLWGSSGSATASRALADAGATLAGSATAAALEDLGQALSGVTAAVAAGMEGLAQSLRVAAETYHRVDVDAARAAASAEGGGGSGFTPGQVPVL